jgi:phosphatidylserine/phosphatidylglycerophosphate/cardiolipin synthase-like enzyme
LIDGAAYFTAFAAAVERAKKSILIVGWDINSRVRLMSDERQCGLPTELGAFLNALVSRRRSLHVHILVWNFAMIYSLERELLPVFTNGWHTSRRVHFAWDGHHPRGASHHQKIVVVDDAVAFVGGLDLTRGRWDTPRHSVKDPHRVDEDGQPYPPFHDVQMVVDGDAAAALGQVVRARWKRATGQEICVQAPATDDPWPPGLQPDLEDVRVAIARTEPAYDNQSAVCEVEALYRDAIAAAQHSSYIENQYLTSAVIGEALAERLRQPQGPDIVLVLPQKTPGWLEKNTMDVLRARVLRRLHEADRFGRLRVYYPIVPGLDNQCLTVHAKVLVVDDRLMRIGSSNLSNRSMGLDTECDLAIEANGEAPIREAIVRFRNRLLGEHLEISPERIAEVIRTKVSLVAAVDALRGGERTFEPLHGTVPGWLDQLIPDSAIVDPARPVDPDTLIAVFVSPENRKPGRRALVRGAVLLLGLLGLATVWCWAPVANWLDVETIADWTVFLSFWGDY